jgi:hypothetical protein
MSVEEICNRNAVLACKYDLLLDVAQPMWIHHIGNIVNVEDIDDSTKNQRAYSQIVIFYLWCTGDVVLQLFDGELLIIND